MTNSGAGSRRQLARTGRKGGLTMTKTVFERKWTGHMHPKEIQHARKRRKWDDGGIMANLDVLLLRSAKAFGEVFGRMNADEAKRYRVTVTVEEVEPT